VVEEITNHQKEDNVKNHLLPPRSQIAILALRDASDWERSATNIPGVFLLKLPSSRTRQATVAIEINPVDATGSTAKKRGIVIRSASELNELVELDQK
jgi:hypothetical protein